MCASDSRLHSSAEIKVHVQSFGPLHSGAGPSLQTYRIGRATAFASQSRTCGQNFGPVSWLTNRPSTLDAALRHGEDIRQTPPCHRCFKIASRRSCLIAIHAQHVRWLVMLQQALRGRTYQQNTRHFLRDRWLIFALERCAISRLLAETRQCDVLSILFSRGASDKPVIAL